MFEAFAIGIRLKLLDNVTSGLVGIAGQFSAFNRHVAGSQANLSDLESRLKRIKTMGVLGGVAMGAGLAGLAAFRVPLEEAAKFDQQVGRFKLFGLGDQVTTEATKFAQGMNIIGTSYTEAMRHVNEAQGVFRESGLSGSAALAGAKLAAPMLAKIDFATAALDDETKSRLRSSSLAMLRFVELRGGLQNASTFNSIANAGWKAIQTSGGNVNWEALRQFMARGGVAAQGLSNTSLFGELEPIIGEMKGSTAGNAVMTAYNRLVGGVRVPNQVAHLLAQRGIWDSTKINWNSLGGIKSFNGNPLRDYATFSSDPTQFYAKDILPMYAKMGLATAQDRARENTMIFGRTGGALFSLIDRQMAVSQRSVAAQAKALGVDASVNIAANTPQGTILALRAQLHDAEKDLGDTVLPVAIAGVKGLTVALKSATHFMEEFPGLTKAIAVGFAGLSGLVAAGGVINLATAGFRGLGLALVAGKAAGLGGMLMDVAGGLGGLAKVAGGFLVNAGLVAGAGFLGYEGAKAMGASKLGEWLSGHVYDLLHPNDGKTEVTHTGRRSLQPIGAPVGDGVSPYIGLPRSQSFNVTIPVSLDGKKIAAPVVRIISKGTVAPQTGVSRFDGSLSLAPAGGVGGY